MLGGKTATGLTGRSTEIVDRLSSSSIDLLLRFRFKSCIRMVECGYCLACCFLEIAGDENNESKNCSFSFQGAMRAMKKIFFCQIMFLWGMGFGSGLALEVRPM